MTSEYCGPCADTECMDVTEEESAALKCLYQRMLDKDQCDDTTLPADCDPPGSRRAKPPYDKETECLTDDTASLLRRFDVFMTAALNNRSSEEANGGNDSATVPDPIVFDKCKAVPAGAVNTTLFGLDVERAVLGPPAEQSEMLDAADSLIKAEAACKHSGAVRAAEMAALKQPDPKYAEDAARIGAKAYTAISQGDKPGGPSTETPIEVVGYVGCTKSKINDDAKNKCK